MRNYVSIIVGVLGLIIFIWGCVGLYLEVEKALNGKGDNSLFIAFGFIAVGAFLLRIGYKNYNKKTVSKEKESIQTKSRSTYRNPIKKPAETEIKEPRTLIPKVIRTNSSLNNIFISYRRSDTANVTGRIYDKLLQSFDKKQLFKDVDSIPLGVDFRKHLNQKVGECNVLIAVIGAEWIEPNTPKGQKRIDDKKDFVRIEIEAALERDIPVIPVLVRDAKMPGSDELPESLMELAFRNGIPVRPDPDFHRDMERLIQGIKHHI